MAAAEVQRFGQRFLANGMKFGSDVLARFGPATQDWFRGAFPRPTDAQIGAWNAISHGKHALVVAPTGSGKTSTMALLHRFYDVWEGEVRVGGHDVREGRAARHVAQQEGGDAVGAQRGLKNHNQSHANQPQRQGYGEEGGQA